ncbi:MAG: GHKL domain-containing protein [Firmicutes bacterium]|nr:GHKL domain-containing protein [Bacillota bacterium]
MKNYFINFFASSIIFYSIIFVWSRLLDEKINYKKVKFYIIWIFLACFSVFNYFFVNNFIRLGFLLVILIICCKILFNHNLKETIVVCIYEQFIIMVSETIFALLLTIFKIDVNLTLNFAIVNLMSNILIAIISLIIVKIKFIKKLYLSILSFTDRIKKIQLSLFSILLMILANVLSMNVYYKIRFEYLLIFNVSMTIICFIIMFYSLKTQNKYNKVSDKYNVAITSLKDYENMMNKYRVANHENKNILLTVRAMIINKEKEIPKFIDSFIENKYEDDERLLFETSVIPMGGLRATIYSEILKIKNNKIKYYLNIDKKISAIDLIEMDENIIIDICKIIGVFIDNAIDEEKNKKNKQIDISMYLVEGNLNIKVSNHYKGSINVEKIYDQGYSTKGKNHGYGLSLVKDIVSNNNLLQNKTELSKNIFSQILIIKYKN